MPGEYTYAWKKSMFDAFMNNPCILRGYQYEISFEDFIQNKECGLRSYLRDHSDDPYETNHHFNLFENSPTAYDDFKEMIKSTYNVEVEQNGQIRGITFRCFNAE